VDRREKKKERRINLSKMGRNELPQMLQLAFVSTILSDHIASTSLRGPASERRGAHGCVVPKLTNKNKVQTPLSIELRGSTRPAVVDYLIGVSVECFKYFAKPPLVAFQAVNFQSPCLPHSALVLSWCVPRFWNVINSV
jgi:hypothetical protein